MELLRGAAGTLRFPDHDGDPVTFDALPTVTVVRHSDGSPVAVGAVKKEEPEGEDVFYTATVDSTATAGVDLLLATWGGDVDGAAGSYTTCVEVVGGFLTSLRAIRKKYGEDDRTDAEIAAAREAATTQIEGACGVAFRPRYGREILDGTGTRELLLRQPELAQVLSAVVDEEALEVGELTVDPAGVLLAPSRWAEGRANIQVSYVHGFRSFPAAGLPVRDLAAYLLTTHPNDWHERATSYTNDAGSYTLVTPGVRGANFPIPSVNAFVQANQFPSVG